MGSWTTKNRTTTKIKHTTMKTLANTSPFLLLLIPVFIMMLLTFAAGSSQDQNEEFATKKPAKASFIKIANPFSR
jgi:L-lactate permease